MPHRIISSKVELAAFTALLGNLKLPFTAEWTLGRNRTLDQNKLAFLWAKEAAEQLGDRTADDVRFLWKLRHGVPIMRADSEAFRTCYDKHLRGLSFEAKCEVMEWVKVTSLMKVGQMTAYLDAIQRECAHNGIVLTDPDPELAAYQARHRMKDVA